MSKAPSHDASSSSSSWRKDAPAAAATKSRSAQNIRVGAIIRCFHVRGGAISGSLPPSLASHVGSVLGGGPQTCGSRNAQLLRAARSHNSGNNTTSSLTLQSTNTPLPHCVAVSLYHSPIFMCSYKRSSSF